MENRITSTYKIRGSGISWGIRIMISARIEESNIGTEISKNLYYENRIENKKLTTQENILLLTGLKWVSNLITDKIENPTKIILEGIKFNECDYQFEGLFYAVSFWASEYFKFDLPDYEFAYDKEKKKYYFPNLTEYQT